MRIKCPRLYLLSDEDLTHILCCGQNLDHFSQNIGRVFNQLDSLNIDSSNKDDLKVTGCFGKNKEYFPLEMPLIFKGSIEELINQLQVSIPISIRYLLELSLAGKPPPFITFIKKADLNTSDSEASTSKPALIQNKAQLPAISESFEAKPPALFTWTFEHTSQVIELTLRILFTKQIEASLKSVEDLRELDVRFKNLISLYQQELCLFKVKNKNSVPVETDGVFEEQNMGLLINEQQKAKMNMIMKLLVFYEEIIIELIESGCTGGLDSASWQSKVRFYANVNADKELTVTVKCSGKEVLHGLQYHAGTSENVFGLEYRSEEVEKIMAVIVGMVQEKSCPLVHGNYVILLFFVINN